jgi:hypothetical protein
MGQTESSEQVRDSRKVDPHAEICSKQRTNYLNRLGIQKNGAFAKRLPVVEEGESFRSALATQLECTDFFFDKPVRKTSWMSPSASSATASTRESTDTESLDTASSEGAASEFGDPSPQLQPPEPLAKQDDFRVAFLRKLSYENVWVPKPRRAASHQTVIVFDWDDTLLCTSYLSTLDQYWSMPPSIQNYLRRIAAVVKDLLELSLSLGQTFIITNAAPMWVQYSAAKYVPDILPVLEKVRVISARGRFEDQFPGQVSQWKLNAFLEVQKQMDSQVVANLIALGDAQFEMEATHAMAREFEVALVKTVKFHETPCPEALLKQLEIIAPKFKSIVEKGRHMKITMEPK